MVPGWKGGKVLPLGGSLGEYSLKDLEEQPGTEEREREQIRGSVSGQNCSIHVQEAEEAALSAPLWITVGFFFRIFQTKNGPSHVRTKAHAV